MIFLNSLKYLLSIPKYFIINLKIQCTQVFIHTKNSNFYKCTNKVNKELHLQNDGK
jgi:hypothetical protein